MGNDPALETESLFGPGERLRVAREAQGLSVEKVAKELRLSPTIIDALEDNNYDQLPAKTFVDGYLKGYARILDLDAAGLIADYHCPEAPLPVAKWVREDLSQSAPLVFHKGIKPSTRKMWLWLLFIIASLAAYLFLSGKASLLTHLSDRSDISGADIIPLILSEQLYPLGAQEGVIVQDTGPAVESDKKTSPVSNKVQVVLSSSGESWVDVRDVNGSRLIFGLLREGDRREISGEPPFQVLLGNSPVIDIVYNNQPFDQSSYNDGKVARFTLNVIQDTEF